MLSITTLSSSHFISLPSVLITKMSRLMGKLPFKGIYTPLRKPLCLPPRRFHYHSFPYSINACQGLVKTYDTLIQARAGFPTRMACVMKRKAKEAREKGEWIDIHDYDHSEPGKYDTIISNVNDEILRTEISEILGIPYLGQVAKRDAGKVAQCIEGYLHSEKCHPILPCVVHTNTGEARWVFFVMDITAPATYLSLQVCPIYTMHKMWYMV